MRGYSYCFLELLAMLSVPVSIIILLASSV